jgi:hypothetical protein
MKSKKQNQSQKKDLKEKITSKIIRIKFKNKNKLENG